MRHAVCCTLTAIALSLAGPVLAQTAGSYPSKPLRLVVGFPAGGPADIFGRAIAQKLSEVIGQQVVVDNRAGAGGIVATENVAKSPAYGYTFYLASSAVLSFYANLYDKLPYDLNRDFVPVTLAVAVPEMLVVHPSLPVKTAKEFVALAKSKPGQLVYGSTGNGASTHLSAAQFASAAKVDIVHVPYRGQGPAMTALLAGDVDLFFNQSAPAIASIKGGLNIGLAVTTPERLEALPGVPAMAQACALPGFESSTWYGLLAPAKLPSAIATKMSATVAKVISTPEFKKWLTETQGITPAQDPSPQAFAKIHRADLAKWAEIVRISGAQVD